MTATDSTRATPTKLRVDADRLWRRLDEMSRIGGTSAGGVHRLALSEEDREARDLFRAWAMELGLRVGVDGIGNMFARREGSDPDRLPVLLGSHLDSQPTGGKYDGPLGVLAGLEVVETLNDAGLTTAAPLEIGNWTNEEGARFAPAMLGSGAFSGRFDNVEAMRAADPAGVTVSEALDAIGYRGAEPIGGRRFAAALELHIEQGPVLEGAGNDIGVVTGVQGTRWYDLTIRGEETHAGPTPMSSRTDPVAALGDVLGRAFRVAEEEFAPDGRLTVGVIDTSPASRNTVPGEVRLTIDIRHPDDHALADLAARLEAEIDAGCRARGAEWELDTIWLSPSIDFDARCIEAVASAARTCGYSTLEMMSGAGHDSVHVADVAPTSMIFIPCADGVSHNESERIEPAQAEAGANVLLQAALELAT